MSSEITKLEAELTTYRQQLDDTKSGLQDDPDNAGLQELKTSLEELIGAEEAQLAELKQKAPPPPKSSPPPLPQEKWSKEKHPAYQAGYRKPGQPPSPVDEPQAPASYKVKDMVMAKWVSGDKAFYPARIDSITGSSAAPVFIVTFKGYGNTETLRTPDIKPMPQDSKKRKADGTPVTPVTSVPPTNSSVISAAANIDPALASQAKREPSKVTDGPARPAKIPKKVKQNKEYEAGKSKWEQFQQKGGKIGKASKKESMFRTGEGVNARVGFTGSGQAMRKDPTRSRHIYQPTDDDD